MAVKIVDIEDLTYIYPKKVSPLDKLHVYTMLTTDGAAPYSDTIEIYMQKEDGGFTLVSSETVDIGSAYTDYAYNKTIGLSPLYPSDEHGNFMVWIVVGSVGISVFRSFYISSWEAKSNALVFNEKFNYFTKESSVISPFYVGVGSNFFSSKDNKFYQHKIGVDLKLYGEAFEPFITFVASGDVAEKIFDALAINLNDVGLKQIEYWTEDQYSKHIWPVVDSNIQVHPWIDPEFRENRWYLPVYPEANPIEEVIDNIQPSQSQGCYGNCVDIYVKNFHKEIGTGSGIIKKGLTEFNYIFVTDYGKIFTIDNYVDGSLIIGDNITIDAGYMAQMNYMRGQWLKIKLTFNSLDEFLLREVVTFITQSIV